MKRRKPPAGWDLVEVVLEEFESRMREAMNEPMEDKVKSELNWTIHRLHYEKNRRIFDMRYREGTISPQMLEYLRDTKIVDGPLIAKWRRPGYETLCSLAVISRSNTNFRTVGICRVPLDQRHGKITPNVQTGCVSCATGDGGPIWWNDPIPEKVMARVDQTVSPHGPTAYFEGDRMIREGYELDQEPNPSRMEIRSDREVTNVGRVEGPAQDPISETGTDATCQQDQAENAAVLPPREESVEGAG
eukprot:CAMPEP_0184683830 /NCGR_PEP_ID=MMETSP0312-20130426/12739_1 /TAXON_ID=31354 /ORGANISM="Compsopogon coeruleus, Strain SAG 36.94" /LENGTH=245 /DNA_ID=CAMNT_0027136467 /DNA_START=106 /DNA_END=843 /DNA_ORIENTATION=-